jgi:hypothetical protein
MKVIIAAVFLLFAQNIFTQHNINEPLQLKLKEDNTAGREKLLGKPHFYSKTELPLPVLLAIPLFFINPILVFEDKKIFLGLTREISFSTFPYGRLSFEYSFLFRTFNKHHLRFSYNYDFVKQPGQEWIMVALSPGIGYFTDTKNNGIFGQLAFGSFIPTPFLMVNLYLKYRYTYTFDKNKSDVHDISLGAGLIF